MAKDDDYKALMALYTDFIERDYNRLDSDSFKKVLASKTNFVMVAQENDSLVGLITASIRPVIRYLQPIMQIDELYVDARFRKHGAGQQLIQAIEDLAHDKGCRRVYVESAYKHKTGHEFYQKNGYEKQGYYFLKKW